MIYDAAPAQRRNDPGDEMLAKMERYRRIGLRLGLRRIRSATFLAVFCTLAITGLASSAYAGNFAATGHDMDLHCAGGTLEECEYLKIVVDKVRGGSTLPILALDQGTELPNALLAAGYPTGEVVTVNPADAPTFSATRFVDSSGHPLFSAIVTASDSTCGGCDNTSEGEGNINARAADFETYFNAGGGILALAGASEFATYYSFVPLKVAATVVEPPFTVTPSGAALGVNELMVNCCATHNSFSIPPSPLVVLENDSAGMAETIGAFGATIEKAGFSSLAEKEKAEQERREREARAAVPVTPPPPPAKNGTLPFKLSSPVLGKTVNVTPVSGTVLVKLPPGAHLSAAGSPALAFESLSKGTGFIPLTEARQIPVGSTLDTTNGTVQLTSATASSTQFQEGDFGAGIFTILQKREQRGLTRLNIVNALRARQVCATLGKKASAARKRLSSKVLGRLNGSAHGKYTTQGQYSAATVRGTIWGVTNRCDGTLTQVKRGVVSVRDLVRRRTITLRAGQQYLAKAP